jgi:uncharacterized protein
MVSLYIVSTEPFSGKTSLCHGIAARLIRDGLRVGYFKPLVLFGRRVEGGTISEDVAFMRQSLDLIESDELLAPVVMDAGARESAGSGKPHDYALRIDRAFAEVARGKDVLVVEGARELVEGISMGLPPQSLAERLGARVLAVAKYSGDLLADGLLAAQSQFGRSLIGAVINQIPAPRLEFVEQGIIPFLKSRGLPVFAALPQERLLLSVTINEIAEMLGGEVLNSPEHGEELVENLMVGAMGVDSALSYFRRKPNKVVITGGDRADIELAALETSTRGLVLTGNLRPNPIILGRAEELGVPLILAKQDTQSTIEIIQQFAGKPRLQLRKVKRFEELMNERFDFGRLYTDLQIAPVR